MLFVLSSDAIPGPIDDAVLVMRYMHAQIYRRPSAYGEALEGVPGIPYFFKYFEKYPLSQKIIPLLKALYHHIPKSALSFHNKSL